MRVLIGLAALASMASLANAQQTLVLSLPTGGTTAANAQNVANGSQAQAIINVYYSSNSPSNVINNIVSPAQLNTGSPMANNGNWQFTIPYAVNTIVWTVTTNGFVAQSQYRYTGYSGGASTWICDPCTTGTSTINTSFGTPSTCNGGSGPVGTTVTAGTASLPTAYLGYPCSNFQRQYTYSNLQVGTKVNAFSVGIYDNSGPAPDQVSFSFTISRSGPPVIGDPQIYGMQGQDFQVHGIPDEIFNLITYPNLQVNARFVYLSSAECHDNFTACFAHPGTYIGEEGIRVGNDKIHIKAGSFKKGLTVAINGQRVASGKHSVKLGSVHIMSHRRVVVSTPVVTLTISNSDKFLNQESALHDQKLLALGAERRVLVDGESFHSEVPLHGLQGQTWRNVEYASGLDYEGSINDYHVVDGNLFGTDFVFNKFNL